MRKLLLKLIQSYFLKVDPRFRPGDLVYYGDNDYSYEIIGIYYSYSLQPFVFIRDPADGRVFGAPIRECKSPYIK